MADLAKGSPHSAHHTPGGHRRRVSRAAPADRQPHDVRRLGGDDLRVRCGRADILGCQVAAAQRVDEPAQRGELGVGLVPAGVAQHDGLAPAERQPGQRVLVRHALRETQHVRQRRVVVRIRPHPDAAEPRPERGVVKGDDGAQPARAVMADHDLLVFVKDLHRRRV